MGEVSQRSAVRTATLLCLAILLAGTKFRIRDTDASINGQLDAQILLELGLYGAVLIFMYLRWTLRNVKAAAGLDGLRMVHIRHTSGEYLLWAYAAWASFSVIWSAAPLLTLVRACQLLTVLLLARATVRELGPGGALRAFSSALVGFVAVCVLVAGVFPWASNPELYTEGDFVRFAWFAVHPIQAASELGIALVLLTAASPQQPMQWRRRWVTLRPWMLGALLGIALVVTYSRGPLLACAAGVAAVLIRSNRYRRIAIATVAVVIVSAVSVLLFAVTDVGTFLENHAPAFFLRGQDAHLLTSFTGRDELWVSLLRQAFDHFWLGYGYQASRVATLEVADWAGYAHNALLQSLLDVGIVGTLLLVAAMATTLLPSLGPAVSRERISTPVIPLMLFLLVNSITNESFAGAVGSETLAFFITVLAAAQLRVPAPRQDTVRLPRMRAHSHFASGTPCVWSHAGSANT